ncbi:MAG: phytoene desaturase family protein, partial [Cellulomonadaceae bacterium]
MTERVVVIGGGIAGLASAALLARAGYDVEVLEQRATVGGRAGSWESQGFRFDTGPSWYLMPEVFDHFFRLLGTSAAAELDLRRLGPAYRVFFERAAPVEVVTGQVAELFESLEPGAGRATAEYLANARETYRTATQRFLYSSFAQVSTVANRHTLRLAPQLLRLLLEPLERLTARSFRDPRIRQILGYPAVFLGTSPDRAPSMYHLMSHLDLDDGVYYPDGGFAHLIEVVRGLAQKAGARIRTGATVTAIRTTPTGRTASAAGRRSKARVTGVVFRDTDGEQSLPADVVVGAADLHHVETALLPRDLQTYPESWWRRRQSGPGAVLIYLGLRGRVDLPHHSLFFTADWDRNFADIRDGRVPEPASAYVCHPSATDPSVAPGGDTNLFVLVPVPADPGLGRGGVDGTGDAEIERVADAAIDQVSTWAGIGDLRDRVVVRRTVGPGDFAADLN